MCRRRLLQFFAGFFDIGANRRAHFHDRLVHLGLDPLLQDQPALLDDLGVDVRPQIPSFGIDGLILLFDSERECRLHRGTHSARQHRRWPKSY